MRKRAAVIRPSTGREAGSTRIGPAVCGSCAPAVCAAELGYSRPSMIHPDASAITAVNPISLRFVDEALERRYRRWIYQANRRYLQLGTLIAIGVLGLIGPVEFLSLSPEVWRPVLAIRYGVVLPICGLMYAFTTLDRWQPFIERYREEVTVLLVPLAFLALGVIGSLTMPALGLAPDGYGAIGFVIAMLFMYLVVRVRFLYAVAVCVPMNALVLPALLTGELDPLTTNAALVFTGVSNVVGAVGCYLIDRSWRRIFLDEAAMHAEWHNVERLLRRILPSSVVPQLHGHPGALAQDFPETTVIFADVVGFTPLAARLPATELVGLLDELFCGFDAMAHELGVAKVKTIGDAWMGVSGAPMAHPQHAVAAAWLARRMLAHVRKVAAERGLELDLRIGLHSGPLVGGVIGKRKIAWDIWGDTVNIAARMESTGVPGQIQLTATTAGLLGGSFETPVRGDGAPDGNGPLRCYWLGAPTTATAPVAPVEPTSIPPRIEALRTPGLHPLTLRFRDRALEARYWADFFARNRPIMRVMGLFAVLSTLPIVPLEAHFFPEIADALNLWRFGLLVPAALVGIVLVTVPVLAEHVALPYLQPISSGLALLCLVALAGMGLEVMHLQRGDPLIYLTLAYLTAMCVLYILLRLPFVYAAALGVATIAGSTVAILTVPWVDYGAVAIALHLGALGCLAGTVAGYSLELADRRHFELRARIATEHQRAESLLANTLPATIARRLDRGEQPLADAFLDVSVVFAELVGFAAHAKTIDATALVALLDDIFRRFDACCDALGAEKIKTMGDAWMAVVGAPIPVENHIGVVAELAFALQDAVATVCAERGLQLALRVGVHRGPLVAGVLGRDRVQFDIWGDTVNVASRMQSHGAASQVHVSAAVAADLRDGFDVQPRGQINVKGRGRMATAFVTRRTPPPVEVRV